MADEFTLEQLQGIKTDPDRETKVAQSLGLPAGTYNSVPETTMDLQEAGPDTAHPGRRSAHFYGFFQGVNVLEDGEGRDRPRLDPQPQGRAGYDVSWDYRDRVDFETKDVLVGKPDNRSKLWHLACQTYRQVHGLPRKEIVEVPDVLNFLSKYAVAVTFRYLEGRDTPLAVSISRAKDA